MGFTGRKQQPGWGTMMGRQFGMGLLNLVPQVAGNVLMSGIRDAFKQKEEARRNQALDAERRYQEDLEDMKSKERQAIAQGRAEAAAREKELAREQKQRDAMAEQMELYGEVGEAGALRGKGKTWAPPKEYEHIRRADPLADQPVGTGRDIKYFEAPWGQGRTGKQTLRPEGEPTMEALGSRYAEYMGKKDPLLTQRLRARAGSLSFEQRKQLKELDYRIKTLLAQGKFKQAQELNQQRASLADIFTQTGRRPLYEPEDVEFGELDISTGGQKPKPFRYKGQKRGPKRTKPPAGHRKPTYQEAYEYAMKAGKNAMQAADYARKVSQ